MLGNQKPFVATLFDGNTQVEINPDKLPSPKSDLSVWMGQIECYLGKLVGKYKLDITNFFVSPMASRFAGDGFFIEYRSS